MANNRGSQRGAVTTACSFLLAGIAALLVLSGCSAGGDENEKVGLQQQALTCGLTQCIDDTCVTPSCPDKLSCAYTVASKQLEACKTPKGNGVCVAHPRDPVPMQCCLGCIVQTGINTYTCIDAPDAQNCGLGGSDCKNCDLSSTCMTHVCKSGQCVDNQPILDDQPCTDQSGRCWQGSCCSGCIDANKNCQPGTATTACGKTGATVSLKKCVNCTDNEPICTTDSCDATGTCVNKAVAENTPCLDANKCDGAEFCTGGKCTDQVGFMCPKDNNPCHAPSCDPNGGCGQQNLSNIACPDADLCNGDEMCSNGACLPGAKKNCDDKNPCTVDSCDAKLGCLHAALEPGSGCDDGNLCNGIGVCDENAACIIKPSPVCNDGDPCTDDKCDPAKGCVTSYNTADCSDNDPCTLVDKCSNGACVGTGALKCDDGKPCTADSCVKGAGCLNDPVKDGTTCDDGNACSTGDQCVGGVCKSSGGKTCPDDGNDCTVSRCDPLQGSVCTVENDNTAKCQVDKCHQFTQCTNGTCPTGAVIDCDDGNPCTVDGCDGATGCTHTNDAAAKCSDGNVCTVNDKCVNKECVGTPMECQPIDDCHVAGTCNDKTGQCDDPRADDTTVCDNGNGTCLTGKCIPNPNAGGAGGEPGVGGDSTGTAGTTTEGGTGGTTANGGTGNEPTTGGEPDTGGSAGKGGSKATAGTTTTGEAGAPEKPEHVFTRDPGGCSCSMPGSQNERGAGTLLALAVGLGLVLRRRRGAGPAPRRAA